MGKTNLLLNLKRNCEIGGNFVLYFDLSFKSATAKVFFRNVIDAIVDGSNEWQFNALQAINEIRTRGIEDAHREYDLSLRSILQYFDKNIIVIFDEIDSIVTASYSDSVFSQIRSMYFSRANHREYERLTYVLSGVAEPSELIKDKNISPFNIGDKVYLHDFTRDECAEFFRCAEIDMDPAVGDEVFAQTGGNPRMTWDLTSELEDRIISGEEIGVDTVSASVEKLYLVQFDRPPVDHIRVLAETDASIRSAISTIRWGAGDTVDEKTRAKLYLAGIIRYGRKGEPIIKNRIIDHALSDRWLADVSNRGEELLTAALTDFRANKWPSVIRLMLAHRDQTKENLPSVAQFQLGLSYLYTMDFENAERELRPLRLSAASDDMGMAIAYNYGVALHRLGNTSEAIATLRHVAAKPSPSRNVAISALISALVAEGGQNNFDEALELGNLLLAQAQDDPDYELIRPSALFSMARANELKGDYHFAAGLLDTAIANATGRFLPALLVRRYLVTEKSQRDPGLLYRAIDQIQKLGPRRIDGISDLDTNDRRIAEIASLLSSLNDLETATFAIGHITRNADSEHELLKATLEVAPQLSGDFLGGIAKLLDYMVHTFSSGIPEADRLEALRLAIEQGESSRKSQNLREYFALSADMADRRIGIKDADGLFLITQAIGQVENNRRLRALKILEIIPKTVDPERVEQAFILLVARQQEMMISDSMRNHERSRAVAREIMELYERHGDAMDAQSEYMAFARTAKSTAERILKRSLFTINAQIPRTGDPFKAFGRNSRVKVRRLETGEIFEGKFKALEEQLRSGKLVIVN